VRHLPRLAALACALALPALPPAAGAAARLGGDPGGLLAVTAGRGQAYAVVGSGDPAVPFLLVRSTGRGMSRIGRFGIRDAQFPDVVAGTGALLVAYGRTISNGLRYESMLAEGGGFGAGATLGDATGPARLALDGPARLAAFPDLRGDAVLGGRDAFGAPLLSQLTDSAPQSRHAPLELIVAGGRPLVLDLVQTGERSELRVLGPDAPADPVLSVGGVHGLDATLARGPDRIYVAYRSAGRAVVASAPPRPGATWSRRRLPARGSVRGAPAVARTGSRTIVATSERVGRQREIYVRTIGSTGVRARRLTRSRGIDLAPQVTVGLDGAVFVGWTRRNGSRTDVTSLLARFG
jgi:hypothetical protein